LIRSSEVFPSRESVLIRLIQVATHGFMAECVMKTRTKSLRVGAQQKARGNPTIRDAAFLSEESRSTIAVETRPAKCARGTLEEREGSITSMTVSRVRRTQSHHRWGCVLLPLVVPSVSPYT
jgi:hypothetical protein